MYFISKYFLFIFIFLCSNYTIAQDMQNKYKKGKINLYSNKLDKAIKNFTVHKQTHPFHVTSKKTNQSIAYIKFIQKKYKESLIILQETMYFKVYVEYEHFLKSTIIYNVDKKKINLLFKTQNHKKNQNKIKKNYLKITMLEKNKNSKYIKKTKINKSNIKKQIIKNFQYTLTTYEYDHITTTEKIVRNLKNFKKNKTSLLYIKMLTNTREMMFCPLHCSK